MFNVSIVISFLRHDIVRAGWRVNDSHRVSASSIMGGVQKEAHQNGQPGQTRCLCVDDPSLVRHLRVIAVIGEGKQSIQDLK